MTIEPAIALFIGIVVIAFAVQQAVGFGAALVCVTVGSHLLDIRLIITLTIPLALLQAGYVVIRDRDAIAGRLLLRRILPLMTMGLAVGFVMAGQLHSTELRAALAVLVIVLAARELWVLRRAAEASLESPAARPPPRSLSIAATLGAGVMHGLYAAGGPLLVYAIGREDLDKRRFRATVSAVWVGLNALLIAGFALEDRYTASTTSTLVLVFMGLPFGLLLGELIHRRIAERPFKISVYAVLIVAAGSLLVH